MAKTSITVGLARLSFPQMFSPKEDDNGVLKYSAAFLFPKGTKEGKAAIKKIEKAIKEVWDEAITTQWGGSDKGATVSFRDGDEEDKGENFEGMMYLNARTKYAPVVVDRSREPIIDPSEVYPGCWGNVRLDVYAFATKGASGKVIKKGVAFGFQAFQKVKDDERLGGGGVDVDDIFEELDDDDMLE